MVFSANSGCSISRRRAELGVLALVAALFTGPLAQAQERPEGSMADRTALERLETEVDVSGPYHAWIDGEGFPANLDIWGNQVTLKISMDGQDRPMVGMAANRTIRVVAKYGAENFNLTTMAEAIYDGWAFHGQYARIDEKLGAKLAGLVLTPDWGGGGGGDGGGLQEMTLPRQESDIPGRYGLALVKDGKAINALAEFDVEDGTVIVKAGGREYRGDYSDKEMFPLFWQGNRMDTFKLTPTETGFKGTLIKEVDGKTEEYEVTCGKGKDNGGDGDGGDGGHDRDWTYVYDVIFDKTPPIWIGKITMHDEQAKLVVNIKDVKARLEGSLVDGILSGTGKWERSAVSIRAQKNPNGFVGVWRQGSGNMVREYHIILKNRPMAKAPPAPSW